MGKGEDEINTRVELYPVTAVRSPVKIMSTDNGVSVDTIEGLSDPLSSMSSLASLVSLLALAHRARRREGEKQERLVALMHAVSPVPSASHSRQEYVASFVRLLSPVLNSLAGMQEFAQVVGG